MQLDMGTSMRRYAPPMGTAGLARDFVSGYSRVPAPPPKIIAAQHAHWPQLAPFQLSERSARAAMKEIVRLQTPPQHV